MNPTLNTLDNFFLHLESPTRAVQWSLVLDLGVAEADGSEAVPMLGLDELRARVAERVDRYPVFRLGVQGGYRRRPSLLEHRVVDVATRCVSEETVDTDAEFHVLLSRLQSQRLERFTPSWRIVLVNQRDPVCQRIVLLVHHAMSDGVAGVGHTALFADGDDRDLRQLDRFVGSERYPSPKVSMAQFGPAVKGFVAAWAQGAVSRRLRRLSRGQRRSVVAVEAAPAQVRQAAADLGAGTSEFLVAAIGESVIRALRESKIDSPRTLRALIPMTLDKDVRHSGNAVSMTLANFPRETTDFGQRLAQVREQLKAISDTRSELALPAVARVSAMLPWPLQSWASRLTVAAMAPDVHIGVNPGHVKLHSVLGRPVNGIYPLSPLLGNPLSFTCMALSTGVHVGVVWDPDALSEDFGGHVADQLAALLPQARVFKAAELALARGDDRDDVLVGEPTS